MASSGSTAQPRVESAGDSEPLERVLEPLRIREVEIPNRIVRTAHATGLSSPPSRMVGEDFVRFHAARARGGVGLTILEATAVHPSSGALAISDDATVAGYRDLMDAVRPHRMRVFQQLFHAGHINPAADGGAPWSVSSVPGVYGVVAEPMRTDQIDAVVAGYAAAARRCRDGGLDGVELHAGHGYLPHQFLSPLYNTRTDGYGGSLVNRMRFTREVLGAIRAAVGERFAVGVRLSASEIPGSTAEDELVTVIEALERDGLIDFLTTSFGDHYRTISNLEGMESPAGYELPSAGRLAAAATVPTIVAGRFRTLAEAEAVLRSGVADMVSMVRAHIADPDLVRKTVEGRAHEVRPCIACNQGCIGGTNRFPPRVGCTVNPAAGFEGTLADELIVPVDRPRRVLVVGGGPAGLEAARVAALRGHRVQLVDAAARLGGAVDVASRAPRYGTLGDIVRWYEGALERAGVEVELGRRITADEIRAADADTVVIATGSRPRGDGFQPQRPSEPAIGVDRVHVRSSEALLRDGPPAGARTALVLDATGHFEAVAVAERLVADGLALTYVTTLPSFAPYVQTTLRDKSALEFLHAGEFTLLVDHHLVEVRDDDCVVRPLRGRREHEVPADVVVLITPNHPNREIHDELAADGTLDLRLIGDAASPRDMQAAIAEGHRVARALDSAALLAG